MKDLDPPKGCTPLPKLALTEASGNPQALKIELSAMARQVCRDDVHERQTVRLCECVVCVCA